MSPLQQKPILHGRDHACGGADPIPGICDLTPDGGLDDEILNHPCLVAFWKLNESSGDIAYDSGPSGYHLTSSTTYAPPTWGEADGPPGSPSAGFDDGLGLNDLDELSVNRVPILSGEFSAEVWFYRNTNLGGFFIGQGTITTDPGWRLWVHQHNTVPFNVTALDVEVGDVLQGTTATAVGTWYYLAATYDSGDFKLYLNGVEEDAASYPSFTAAVDTGIWIGNDPADAGQLHNFDGNLSYAAVYDCALSAAEVASHYSTGILGGAVPAGYVLTTDGSGGRSWAAPTIEVEF